MIPQPPPGQGPIDPRGAFTPPPPPEGGGGFQPPVGMPPGAVPSVQPGMPPGGGLPPQMMRPWMYPPMMPMMPPPRRSSVGRVLLFLCLLLLLAGSVILNVLLIAGSTASSFAGKQTTLVEGDPAEQVAVVPLEGIIDQALATKFDHLLTRAGNDKSVKAVVIQIDSPGGTVTASDEIYNRIQKFKSQKAVPIVVSMGGMATSGGYYAACAADYVFAQETTLTGNIGVLLPRYNVSGLMDKWGIKEDTIVSEGATFKNAGSPFKPDNPEDTAYLQGIADHAFARFKKVVQDGRSKRLKEPLEAIANGKVYVAGDAKAKGLVDAIGYLDDATGYAAKQAMLKRPTVIKYQDLPTLLELFSAQSRFGGAGPSGQSVNVNGVNVNLDPAALDRLLAPRLMYLWRGE